MIKSLAAFVTAALLAAVVPPAFAGPPDKALHKKCLYPTVQLTTEGKPSFGSGVIVRSVKIEEGRYHNVVVTCAHVTQSYPENNVVKVFVYKNWSEITEVETFPIEYTFHDETADLSLGLFVTDRPMPVAEIDFGAKLFIGSRVLRVGCGLGDEPRLDRGEVTSVKTLMKNMAGNYRTNVHTLPGDSGGPLFAGNKVVGIAHAIRVMRGPTGPLPVFNVSFYIPVGKLKDLDEEWCNSLGFAWGKAPMPQLPVHRLRLRDFAVEGVPSVEPR